MEFKALYPEDDKSNLSIEKLDNESVKFLFKILPEYIGRIGVTLSTTIGGIHSGGENINLNIKNHLNKIIEITNKNDDIICKTSDNILKIMKSYGSNDITISTWFTKPKTLGENIEVTINRNNCNPEIIDNLFSILSIEKNLGDKYGKY